MTTPPHATDPPHDPAATTRIETQSSADVSGAGDGMDVTGREASVLAAALRDVPVTVLHGGTAAERAELLGTELLPLLGRRPLDQPASGQRSRATLRAPQRHLPLMRRRPADRNEVVLVLRDWRGSPLPSLAQTVRQACSLAPAASELRADAAVGLRVLLVLQAFDEFLALDPARADVAAFRAELVAAVNPPRPSVEIPAFTDEAATDTSVHLLLLVQDQAAPALAELGRQLPGFGVHTLKLSARGVVPAAPLLADAIAVDSALQADPAVAMRGATAESVAEPLPQAAGANPAGAEPTAMAAGVPADAPEAPPAALSDDDWLASLQGVIERVAHASRDTRADGGFAPTASIAAAPTTVPATPAEGRAMPLAADETEVIGNAPARAAAASASASASASTAAAVTAPAARAPEPAPATGTPADQPAMETVATQAVDRIEPTLDIRRPSLAAEAPGLSPHRPALQGRPAPRRWRVAAPLLSLVIGIGIAVWAFGERPGQPASDRAQPPAAVIAAAPPDANLGASASRVAPAAVPAPAPAPVRAPVPAPAPEPAPAPAPATPLAAAPLPEPTPPSSSNPAPQQPNPDADTTIPGAIAPEPASGSAINPAAALVAALRPLPVLDLRSAGRQAANRLAAARQPTLALVRYHALQALPARIGGSDALRVVAPLYTESLQAWVRADSKLQHLHQLAGRTLDLGASRSGDALTAGVAYRALFGRELPSSQTRHAVSTGAALAALRAGQVDAVLRVRGNPAQAVPAGLRALTLDPAQPSTTRARRLFLAVALPPGAADRSADARTLGVMNFLVSQAGSATASNRLAGQAMRSLCSVLPELRRADAASWSAVQPASALPAGRLYAPAALQAGKHCDSVATGNQPNVTAQTPR